MKEYFDKTFFMNPLYDYLRWLTCKMYYQLKNWGKHLRINYKCVVVNSEFGKYVWLGNYSYIYNCKMGDFTYCNDYCMIGDSVIGKFCSIGPGVKIALGKHPTTTHISTHPSTFNNQPNFVKNFVSQNTFKSNETVTIGNDVWIGANCLIIDGVDIADGAIVAANSVVDKNVGPFEIVGGTPAKFIKKRFKDTDIETLLNLQWWDKGDEWIQQNIKQFSSVDEFINNNKQR